MNTTIYHIPDEALTHALRFLSIEDRRKVRLVSRRLYSCASTVSITKREKFVVLGSQSNSTEAFLNASVLRSTVEFHKLSVSELPAELWSEWDRDVRSLKFQNCTFTQRDLLNVIQGCTRLKKLEINHVDVRCGLSAEHVGDTLENLFQSGVTRMELEEISLTVSHPLAQEILRKLFLVFRSLRSLSVSGHVYSCANFTDGGEISEPLQPTLLQRVVFVNHRFTFANLRCDSLTELSIPISKEQALGAERNALANFFATQKSLRVVDLQMRLGTSAEFAKDVLFLVLSLPTVLDVAISTASEVTLSSEDVSKLVTLMGKLRRFCLQMFLNAPLLPPASLGSKSNLENLSLKSSTYMGENRLYSHLLHHCPALKHLKFVNPTANVLQQILDTQLELEKLHLAAYPVLSDDDAGENLFGGDFSIERLTKLEKLTIEDADEALFTEEFVKRIVRDAPVAVSFE